MLIKIYLKVTHRMVAEESDHRGLACFHIGSCQSTFFRWFAFLFFAGVTAHMDTRVNLASKQSFALTLAPLLLAMAYFGLL